VIKGICDCAAYVGDCVGVGVRARACAGGDIGACAGGDIGACAGGDIGACHGVFDESSHVNNGSMVFADRLQLPYIPCETLTGICMRMSRVVLARACRPACVRA
jgi:hypothetical protein